MTGAVNQEKPSSEPAWYCVQAQPKHEHIAAASLRIVEGVETFCPRLRYRKATRRGPVWFVEAMFPGYLFARFDFPSLHRAVRHAHGVSTIVHFGTRVPELDDLMISMLREQCAGSENDVVVIDPEPALGGAVKVAAGAFFGLETIVTRVIPARKRICILLDFLGRQVEAEVSHGDVVAAGHLLNS